MLTTSVFVLALALLAKGSHAISVYDDFLQNRDKSGIVWINTFFNLNGVPWDNFAEVCEDNALVRYSRNLEEKTIILEHVEDDLACVNCLVQDLFELGQGQCDTDVPISGIVRNHGTVNQKVVDKKVKSSTVVVCENSSEGTQDCVTSPKTHQLTDTSEWKLGVGGKLSSSGEVKIPMISGQASMKFSPDGGYSVQSKINKSVTAEAQKFTVPPRTSMKVSLVVSEVTSVHKYTVDLEVDEGQGSYDSYRFKDFRELVRLDHQEYIEMHFYNNQTGFFVVLSGDNTVIRNVPVTETIKTHRIEVQVNTEELSD